MCICVCIHIYIYTHVYVHACIHLCVYVYIYIYIIHICLQHLVERDLLALAGDHAEDVRGLVAVAEAQLHEVVEALPEVRLHRLRPLRLREDLQQLVVGEEEEAREGHALGQQVVLQRLLDRVQRLVRRPEPLEAAGLRAAHLRHRVLLRLLHGGLPLHVDVLEHLALVRQLLPDVAGVEDALEVHPVPLDVQPLVEGLLEEQEVLLPLLHLRK